MRWRILISVLLALLCIPVAALSATKRGSGDGRSKRTPAVVPSGQTKDTGNGVRGVILSGGGGGAGTPKPGTTKAAVRVSCPGYERRNVRPVNVVVPSEPLEEGELPKPIFGIFVYRCAGGPWVEMVGCVLYCTSSVPEFIPPPTPDEIRDYFASIPLRPEGWFAPPIHRGAAAITGLRLYASVTPQTYREISDSAFLPGGWWATATATPGEITLEANDDIHVCDGPTADPRTAAGRENSDCYVLITDVPEGGRDRATLSVEWLIQVVSNVPGIQDDAWYVTTSTTIEMPVKELQAVIVK